MVFPNTENVNSSFFQLTAPRVCIIEQTHSWYCILDVWIMDNHVVLFSVALICLDNIYHNGIIICLKTDLVVRMDYALQFG